MKLATLRTAEPDGRLVVVSRDLTRCTDARRIAPTLQAALDDWTRCGPELAAIARDLEIGAEPVQRFHERDALSPLPRPPCRFETPEGGARPAGRCPMAAPRTHLSAPGDAPLQVRIALAALIAQAPPEADSAGRSGAIALIMPTASGHGPEGERFIFGAPVAATQDEIGAGWAAGTCAPPPRFFVNGAAISQRTAPQGPYFARVLAELAQAGPIGAGAMVAAALDPIERALTAGETLRIEMLDAAGRSLFGAIELQTETPAA